MQRIAPLLIFFLLLGSWPADSAELTEKFMVEPIFGTRIRIVEASPEKPLTLILLHGVGPDGATIWDDFIPEMALDFHVIACDLPGFGASDKPNVLYSPENYSAFLDWLVNQTTTDRFILAGHSLGGALALHYTATAPLKPEQLILIDVAGILHRAALTKFMSQINVGSNQYFPSRPLAWFNRFTGTLIEKLQGFPLDVDRMLKNQKLRKKILQADPNKIAGLALLQTDFTPLIKQVTVPTTLIWGEHDNIAPLRTGRFLADRLPMTQLDIIPNCGHTPMRQQPDLFRQSFWQAVLSPPQMRPPETIAITDRMGLCRKQKNATFNGHYQKIELDRCQNVRLVDVTTGSLSITSSDVTIENCRIKGNGIGLKAVRSRVNATTLEIEADLPIQTDQSKFDFVGASLKGSADQLIVGEGKPSRLLFSVSRGSNQHFNRTLHEVIPVTRRHPFRLVANK